MVLHTSRALVLGLGLVLTAAACSPSEEEAVDDLRGLSERIMDEGREVVTTLEDAGLPVESATGVGETCQMEPAPGATFSLGGALTEQAPYEEQYEAAREALTADGWEVTDSGVHQGDSWANLSRDDFKVDLRRTSYLASDNLVFGLVQEGDACLDVPDGSFTVPDDLKEVELVPEEPAAR